MELVSIPYAMYAEKALGLAPNILVGDIPDAFATDDELDQERNDRIAGDANDLTTATIFGGDISGVYNALELGVGVVGTTEISDGSVQGSDINFSAGGAASIDSRYVNVAGDTMSCTSGNPCLTVNGDIATTGNVDGTDVGELHSEVVTARGSQASLGERINVAHNNDGTIKGGGYSAFSFKITYGVEDATNLCTPAFLPAGFVPLDCLTGNVDFVPIITQFDGDGGGTERLNVTIVLCNFGLGRCLSICADSVCDNTGSNKAAILAIGHR